MGHIPPLLLEISRIGLGIAFFILALLDFATKPIIFEMMSKKNIPSPKLFFIGAIFWKTFSSIALIFNIFTVAAALLLSLYIFLANCVFNSFWLAPKSERYFQLVGFLTNIAISFGLLAVAAGYQFF